VTAITPCSRTGLMQSMQNRTTALHVLVADVTRERTIRWRRPRRWWWRRWWWWQNDFAGLHNSVTTLSVPFQVLQPLQIQ